MPDYVVYNPASTPVAGVVTNYLRSFPKEREAELTPAFLEVASVAGITLTAAKVSGGVLQNLSPAEVSSIQAAQAASSKTILKAAAKSIFLNPDSPEHQAIKLGFQTLAEIMVSEINILRAQHSLAARTVNQVNSTFTSTYEAKIDAL